MSELIEREAVREFIKSYSHSTDVVYHMEKQLYEVPTIDAVPVRHGEWIEDTHTNGTTTGGYTIWHDYTCSVCGGIMGRKGDAYCYNCGARMDGERREG